LRGKRDPGPPATGGHPGQAPCSDRI